MLLVKSESMASRYLDVLRFLAALVVFICHGMGKDEIPGYQSVMVFFVLSGYLIGSSVLKSIRENRWSWSNYLINRVTRLWIVLLPALVLTLFWSSLQQSLLAPSVLSGAHDWKTFIGNAFFLQQVMVSVFGQNTPLWSLSYEFWYYILFPCLLLAFFSKTWYEKCIYGLLFIGIALFLGDIIMEYFLIWLLGAILAFLKPVPIKRRKLALGATIVAALISMKLLYYFLHIVPSSPPQLAKFVSDFSVGAAFTLLIYIIICLFNDFRASESRLLNSFKYAAGFSFTLYLVHEPVLNFLAASRTIDSSILNTSNGLLKLCLKTTIFFGIFIYAWLISLITETKTESVRKWLLFQLTRKIRPYL